MCSPVLAVMAVSTLVTAYGQKKQGDTAKAIGEYNAQVSQFAAKDAIDRGNIQAASAEDAQRARVRQIRGAQTAAIAAGGISASSGTAAQVLDQTTQYGEMDAENMGINIRNNAARQAWGYQNQANMDLMGGSAAQSAGNLSAFGTIIAGGARAYGTWKGTK